MNAQSIAPLQVIKALSFKPSTCHVLKVVQGRAWVTLEGECGQDNPDIFLQDGEEIWVAAGQHLVLEAWSRHPGEPLWVQWQIAYDGSVDLSKDQGIACPPATPKPLPAKAT